MTATRVVEVMADWSASAPVFMVHQYLPALKTYRAIALDAGDQDPVPAGIQRLHELLDNYGIRHSLDIYPGDHVNRIDARLTSKVLPFFAEQLASTRNRARGFQAPTCPRWQICSICIGAFGIQFGFALPQANATRIFQNLGASLENVPLLWLAGPITGLIVPPLVGYYSDRTWTRIGRRRPYFLIGAALAACTARRHAQCHHAVGGGADAVAAGRLAQSHHGAVPRASSPTRCRSSNGPSGYVDLHVPCERRRGDRQSAALGLRAARVHRRSAPPGEISAAVKYAFYVGAALLLAAVCWSALSTREYPPAMLDKFDEPRA